MRTRTLLALLLLIPLSDALLLVVVAQYIDLVPTVALVVLTGLVGMLLVRAEGRHTLRNLQTKFARGDLPTNELMDGGLLIAAGAFLLTPGLVTDTIGFLIAIPVTRYPIREVLKRVVVKPYLDKQAGGFVTGDVWTAGFPQDDTGGDGVYDADPDSYRFGGQDSE
ncbi:MULTISPECIES: FxsA family protein [Haloferax]|nr:MULTISPECIES: FxsA family protein [Haloferax]